MDYVKIIFLGIIQGLTEFFPISSSGHLVVFQHLLNITYSGVLLEVVLHMGTLFAILIFYKKDIKQIFINFNKKAQKYILLIIIATVPSTIIGLLYKDLIELAFNYSFIKYSMLISGLVVGSTYFINQTSNKKLIISTAFIIGLAQIFSLFPGISRSGMTISVAIILGVNHRDAAKFSFFMAIPILLGAGILELLSNSYDNNFTMISLILGFLASFITGYLVINWFLIIIKKGKLYYFSIYCFLVSILIFFTS